MCPLQSTYLILSRNALPLYIGGYIFLRYTISDFIFDLVMIVSYISIKLFSWIEMHQSSYSVMQNVLKRRFLKVFLAYGVHTTKPRRGFFFLFFFCTVY